MKSYLNRRRNSLNILMSTSFVITQRSMVWSLNLDSWRPGWTNLYYYPGRGSTPETTKWYVCITYLELNKKNYLIQERHWLRGKNIEKYKPLSTLCRVARGQDVRVTCERSRWGQFCWGLAALWSSSHLCLAGVHCPLARAAQFRDTGHWDAPLLPVP